MRALHLVGAVLCAVIPSGAVYAQQIVSNDIVVKPMIRGSEVVGCGIEYVAAFHDHTYRQGGISGVSGSVTLLDPKDGRTPGMMFKLIGVDFMGADLGKLQPFKVASANVMLGRAIVAKGQAMQCENPMGVCSIHQGGDWIKVAERMAQSGKLTVSFSRTATGLAVVIDIPVNEEALRALIDCMGQMR
jgi:hypothetical protein